METIINILVCALTFFIGAKLLDGVSIKDYPQAIIVALVVGFLDFTLGTFLKIITLGLLSMGIFTWFLNAILIQIADWFLPGLEVKNFWWALALSAITSIAGAIIGVIF